MAAGSIVVELLAATGSFTTDIDRSTKAAEARFKAMEKTAAQVGAVIGASLAGAAAAAVAFGKTTVDAIDSFNDVADATGSTVESISALEAVALRTGGDLDTVSGILVKFNSALKDIKDGSGVDRVLKAIGLSAEELKKLDPAEALRQTAVALAQYADDGDKARAVQILFGKSIKEAAPFLKDLAEQGQLNATVTKAQAEEAEKFNKHLSVLKANATDAGRAIVSDLLPALNSMFDRIKKDGGLLERVFTNAGFDTLSKARKEVEQLGLKQQIVASRLEGLLDGQRADPGNPAIAQAIRATRDEMADLIRQTDAASARLKTFADITSPPQQGRRPPNEGGGRILFENRLPDLKDEPKGGNGKKTSEAERYLESLQKQLNKSKELTAVETVLDDLQSGRLKLSGDVTRQQLIDAAKLLDVQKQSIADQAKFEEFITGLVSKQRDLASAGARVFDETRTPAEALAAELSTLQMLLDKGAISWDTYGRAQDAAQDRYENLIETVKEDPLSKRLDDIFESTATGALADFISGTKSAKDAFKDFASTVIRSLAEMAAKAAAADIYKTLSGSGGGTATGGIVSAIGSFLGGIFTASKAGGGDVMPGREYLVGENGPERFRPRTFGTVLKNGGDGAQVNVAGPVVNIKIENAPAGTTATASRGANGELDIVARIGKIAVDAVAGSLASGGGPIAQAGQSRFGWQRQTVARR